MISKVVVIEDDTTLLETLSYNLEHQGYETHTESDGRRGLALIRSAKPDLVILDIMLPGMDGFQICRAVRKEYSVPILMLTARSEEVDRVIGLEMGADDYLTKPFSIRELMARVKALLRRVQLIRDDLAEEVGLGTGPLVARTPILEFGEMIIDAARREVRLAGKPISMKPKVYELLLFLARHQGIALSRTLILERVWGWTYDGSSRTVDVHVRWLRESIEPDPGNATRIVTVRGVGYRFEG